MTFVSGILVGAVLVIMAMALFFVVCKNYEEGVLGNAALVLLLIACAVVLFDAATNRLEMPQPVYLLMILCFAVFIARHAWRFAMFHWAGWFGWSPPSDMKTRAAEH